MPFEKGRTKSGGRKKGVKNKDTVKRENELAALQAQETEALRIRHFYSKLPDEYLTALIKLDETCRAGQLGDVDPRTADLDTLARTLGTDTTTARLAQTAFNGFAEVCAGA